MYKENINSHIKNIDVLISEISEPFKQFEVSNNVVKLQKYLADFGFLMCIAKSFLLDQNITLYTGSNHSERILQNLQKIGYEVLFYKKNKDEEPLSQEDCETFFSIQPEKKIESSPKNRRFYTLDKLRNIVQQQVRLKQQAKLKNIVFASEDLIFVKSKL